MPELPEVESTRRFLEPAIVGKRIMDVSIRRPRMTRRQPHPPDVVGRMKGRTVKALSRHGKFMIGHLTGDLSWVTHLGMSGRLSVNVHGEPEVPHTNVVITFGRGVELRFVDPRTFGFVAVYTNEEFEHSPVAMLGPDTLTNLPSASALQVAFAGRTAPIKAILLDQRILAGLGNIYADEALFAANVSPHRPSSTLHHAELVRLRKAIKSTLADGLRWGGTSLDDLAYLLPDGRAGEFADRLAVYGRTDEPCGVCGTPIARTVLRQRGTHWCPTCQPSTW